MTNPINPELREQLERDGLYKALVYLHKQEHDTENCFCTTEISGAYRKILEVVAKAITEAQIQELTLLDNAYDESKSNFHEYYFDRLAYLTTKQKGSTVITDSSDTSNIEDSMSNIDSDDLDDIEKDLAESFEQFRRAQNYEAATSVASEIAAKMFTNRFIVFFKHEIARERQKAVDELIEMVSEILNESVKEVNARWLAAHSKESK